MAWSSIRDPPAADMIPPEDTPSSLGQGARESLKWSSITSPVGSVTLHKIEEKKHKNMSSQRTSRGAQKVWRLLLY